MLYNDHLKCVPEIKQYKLLNLLNGDERLVTMDMVKEAFSDRPAELKRILGNRSDSWFLEEYFYE